MTTIIILSIVAILVVIGATQRKKIALLIKSEVKDFTDKHLNSIKVARLRIDQFKEKGRSMVDQAARLKALEENQQKTLLKLKENLSSAEELAKKAKENNDKTTAISKLALAKEIKNQIKLCEENILTATTQRQTIEIKINKLKNQIESYEIQIEGLQARKDTNDVLKETLTGGFQEDTLSNIMDTCETKISNEEVELEYKSNIENDIDDEKYSQELENEYEKL